MDVSFSLRLRFFVSLTETPLMTSASAKACRFMIPAMSESNARFRVPASRR